MEAVANQILDTLSLLHTKKNPAAFKELESQINVYVNFFPQSIAHQNDGIQGYKETDYYLYGQIVDKILSVIENYPTVDDSLLMITNKVMVIDYTSFSMFYELIMILDIHLKKSVNPATAHTIFVIYQHIMKSNALYSAIIDICNTNNYKQSEEKHGTIEQKWKIFLQLLVSLPYKLTNKIRGKENEDCFQIETYSKLLTFHVSRALLFLNNEYKQHDIEPNFGLISSLISKSMIALGSNKFVDLFYILQTWSLNNKKNMQLAIQKILYFLERSSVESAAVLFLKSIENSWEVNEIFGNIINVPQWKHVLTTKIPLLSYYTNDNLIINLVSYLCCFSSEDDILTDLLSKLLNIWGNKSALSHISIDQHEYIAKLIIASVAKLKDNSKIINTNEIKKLLFDGTFVHLNSLDIQVRAIGMITSELVISNFIEKKSENSLELKYDYNTLPNVGKNMVTKIRSFSDYILEQNLQKKETVSFTEIDIDDGDKKVTELGVCCGIISNNTEDSQASATSNNGSSEKTRCEIITKIEDADYEQKHECYDIDSDDDLIPYNISSKDTTAEKTKPTYLRDLKDTLVNSVANNSSDLFSESLKAAEDLILSQLPNDDSSFAIELLSILLMLRENVCVENFKMLKFQACVAVVMVYPKECAKFLCDQFHSESKEITIDDRLTCLKILAEAAKKISELDVDSKLEKSTTEVRKKYKTHVKTIPLLLDMGNSKKNEICYDNECEVPVEPDNTTENWKEIIERRIESNTRRITQKKKSSRETINKFNNVASHFVYPLIYGMMQNHTFLHKLPDQFADVKNILLVNFLHTLSILMTAAENCIIAPRLALSILELAWSLRYHEEANIRLTTIRSIATVVVTLSQNNFTSEILTLLFELKLWLADVSLNSVTGDPDINCRNLGKSVMFLIDSVVKSSMESL